MDTTTKPILTIVRSPVADADQARMPSERPATRQRAPLATSDLIDEDTLAGRLGVSRATLQAWRYAGRGPSYIKVGRFIRYRNADVEAFLERNARAFGRAGA
jgi:predicted DNA-binding transcriptional regulator AlpA